MSAICGVFHLDGHPGVRGEIAGMSAAIAHRGREREGAWSDDHVALAHRMLFTTPESMGEVQPVVHSDRPLVLVADGRIDNRQELLAALTIPGGRGATDSEIILAAYRRWHQGCVDHLIGDFAFAVWDAGERSLFCARDAMGVKPLYYFRNHRLFAFASELKALLTLADVTKTPDPDQVALFVGWSHEDRTRTIYRDMMRLPAAHTLLVTGERFITRQFWQAESARDVRFRTKDQYSEAFREIFSTAVGARLRCAFPVGSTLSGGLDSSSVVCMSRQLRRNSTLPLHTFSVVFPDLPEKDLRVIDERAFVDAVVQQGGLQPHFLRGDELSPLRDLGRVLWHLDEPFTAPNLYLHWAMFEAANKSGVRVLLDGFDGDSVVSHGFGRLTNLARQREWKTLETEIRSFSALHGKAPQLAVREYVLPHLEELARGGRIIAWLSAASEVGHRFGLSFAKLVAHGLPFAVPAEMRELSRHFRGEPSAEGLLLQPKLERILRRQENATRDRNEPLPSERAEHLHGLSQPLYQLALETADKSAAAFGVEPRYPFFDRRLIEFCLGLPEDQKFAAGWPRLILRRAMEGILPPAVQWRSNKSNLSPNFHRRFRAIDVALAETLEDKYVAPYIRTDRLRRMLDSYRARQDSAMKSQALVLFRIITLGTWLKGLSDDGQPRGASSPAPVTAAA